MKHVVGILCVVLTIGWVIQSCSGDDRTGNPAVYEQIEAETDCSELQATFDRNSERFDLAEPATPARDMHLDYMEAALDRMEDLGCP